MHTNQENLTQPLNSLIQIEKFSITEFDLTDQNIIIKLEQMISKNSDWINHKKIANTIKICQKLCQNEKRNSNFPYKMFLIYEQNDHSNIFSSLALFQHINRKYGALHTEWILGTWMYEYKRLDDILDWIYKDEFLSILNDVIEGFKSNISYIFWDFLENSSLIQLYEVQHSSNISNYPYALFYYPFDLKKQNPITKRNFYLSRYGFVYYNSNFNPDLIPFDLPILWKKANKIYFQLKNYEIPYLGKNEFLWKKMLQRKTEIKNYQVEIQNKLSRIKKCFSNNLSSADFFQTIIEEMKNIKLTFQIIEIPVNNPQHRQLLQEFQNDLLIYIIESIPTHGSLFNQVAHISNEINPNFFKFSYLEQIFGNFVVIMFLQLENGKKVCLGYSCASYKNNLETHCRIIQNGIIIGEKFRRYSLGKIFAYVGARVGARYGDIFYEDALISNKGTLKMIASLDFKEFGTFKNFKFTYNFKENKFLPVALNRKYWFTNEFSRRIRRQIKKNNTIPIKTFP
ncbi:MAG: hypothetical protein ACTSX0_00240 [Promethearchaeota archaeon]